MWPCRTSRLLPLSSLTASQQSMWCDCVRCCHSGTPSGTVGAAQQKASIMCAKLLSRVLQDRHSSTCCWNKSLCHKLLDVSDRMTPALLPAASKSRAHLCQSLSLPAKYFGCRWRQLEPVGAERPLAAQLPKQGRLVNEDVGLMDCTSRFAPCMCACCGPANKGTSMLGLCAMGFEACWCAVV